MLSLNAGRIFLTLSEPQIYIKLFAMLLQVVCIMNVIFYHKNDSVPAWLPSFAKWLYLFILVVSALHYIVFNNHTPSWDQSRHAGDVVDMYNRWKYNNWGIVDLFLYCDFYPTIPHLVALPFLALFGVSYQSVCLSLPLFWTPLAYIYSNRFAKLYLDKTHSHLSSIVSLIMLSFPLIYSLGKDFFLDYQCYVLVIVAAYYLILNKDLKSLKYSIYTGIVVGLGTLTKHNFILYVIPILMYIAIKWGMILVYRIKKGKKDFIAEKLFHYVLILVVAGILFLPWYMTWGDLLDYTFYDTLVGNAIREGDPVPFSLDSFVWYPKIIEHISGYPLAILGLVCLFFSYKLNKKIFYFTLGALSLVYLLNVAQYNKEPRYIISMFVFFVPIFCLVLVKHKSELVKLCFGYVVFAQLVGVYNQGHKKDLFFPGAFSSSFAAPSEPTTIDAEHNVAEIFAASKKMFSLQYPAIDIKMLPIKSSMYGSGEYSFYGEVLYENIYFCPRPLQLADTIRNKGLKKDEVSILGNKLLIYTDSSAKLKGKFYVGRDRFSNTYHLINFSKLDTCIKISKLQKTTKVSGDFTYEVKYFTDSAEVVKTVSSNNLEVYIGMPQKFNKLEISISLGRFHGRHYNFWENAFAREDLGDKRHDLMSRFKIYSDGYNADNGVLTIKEEELR